MIQAVLHRTLPDLKPYESMKAGNRVPTPVLACSLATVSAQAGAHVHGLIAPHPITAKMTYMPSFSTSTRNAHGICLLHAAHIVGTGSIMIIR
jgi:hypothetical protein